MTMTLADVPLETRLQAVRVLIHTEARLGVRRRRDLLAAALWPVATVIPERAQRSILSRDEVRAQAVAAYRAGEGSFRVVAERFDVPVGTLKSWVNPPPPRPPREVSVDQAEARRLYQQGATIDELAQRYGEPWLVVRGWLN